MKVLAMAAPLLVVLWVAVLLNKPQGDDAIGEVGIDAESEGVEIIDTHEGQLQNSPLTGSEWSRVRDEVDNDEKDDRIAALIDAIRLAASRQDHEALANIVKELRSFDSGKTQPLVEQALAKTRTTGPNGDISTYAVVIANLMILAYPANPEVLLQELRRRWTNPGVDAAFARWESIEERPISVLASGALNEVERVEASALVDVLIRDLFLRETDRSVLLELLKKTYSGGIPIGERPDAWLSHMVGLLRNYKRRVNDAAWKQCEEWLHQLHESRGVSSRLRRQLAIVLVEAPTGYWELMDTVREAQSIEEVGEALRQYLEKNSLVRNELEMLIDLLMQRFGTAPNQFRELLFQVAYLSQDTVPKERLQRTACSLIHIAQESSDGQTSALCLRMIYGLLQYWRMQRVAGNDFGSILLASEGVGLEDLENLYLDIRVSKEKYDNVETGLLLARIIELAFYVDDTLSNRIQVVCDMIGDQEALGKAEVVSILNGLEQSRREMSTGHSYLVTQLLTMSTEKYDYASFYNDVSRPLKPRSRACTHLRQIGCVLESCALPKLSPSARAHVQGLARAVLDASQGWGQEDRGRMSAEAVAEIVRYAEELSKTYK